MKSAPDNDDTKLFREAVRDVKPLTHERPVGRPTRPSPKARFTRADRHAVLREGDSGSEPDAAIEGRDELAFHRPHVPSTVLRKLRRGQYQVQAEMDLHGMTVVEATQVLRDFLVYALTRELHCVRIVHGKGLRSGNRGPVLKVAVSGLLRRTAAVLAFVSARQADGGTGAVYVLLSR